MTDHETDHVTDHVTGHVTDHVTGHVTDHVIGHVTGHVLHHMLISYMHIASLLLSYKVLFSEITEGLHVLVSTESVFSLNSCVLFNCLRTTATQTYFEEIRQLFYRVKLYCSKYMCNHAVSLSISIHLPSLLPPSS